MLQQDKLEKRPILSAPIDRTGTVKVKLLVATKL